jgi:CRISPR-associated protein Cas2
MEVLVAYDISTETLSGQARLRRVAKICEGYGQRVQKSVFECLINEVQFELLKRDLEAEIEPRKDSIRIYRLREPHRRFTWLAGRGPRYDLHGSLVIGENADPE